MTGKRLVGLRLVALPLAALLVTGCPHAKVLGPQTSPPAPPSGGSGTVTSQVQALPKIAVDGPILLASVTSAADHSSIEDAAVSLLGPCITGGYSSPAGALEIGPLATGSFAIRAQASGYLPWTGTIDLPQPRATQSLAIELERAPRVIKGTILAPSGHPLADARVQIGQSWTLSDSSGEYAIEAPSAGTVEIAKAGYSPATSAGGPVTLSPAPERLDFANLPFGQPLGSEFSQLEALLSSDGWVVGQGLADPTVELWASPQVVHSADVQAAQGFVQGGGKLVVLGEWGGSGDYAPGAADRLLLPFGVEMDADLLRDPGSQLGRPEWIAAQAGGLVPQGTVDMFGAASVFAAPPEEGLAYAPQATFKVQDLSEIPVAAVRQVGLGLVVAVGDASAFTDPYLAKAANAAFIHAILDM